MDFYFPEILTPYSFARFCFNLQKQDLLFHFDDADTIIPTLFEPKIGGRVRGTIDAAIQMLDDPIAFACLANYAQGAITSEWGSEQQVNYQNEFFASLASMGVDIEGDLAEQCLKSTAEEMIELGYEALKGI